VRSVYIDTKDKIVERAECSKGVEVGKGQFVPLTEEAIEASTEHPVGYWVPD
jgi:non-homologous end joining protein Ku